MYSFNIAVYGSCVPITFFVYILAQVMDGRKYKFTAPPSFTVH